MRAVIDLDVHGPVVSRHHQGHFAEHLGTCIYGGFYVGPDSEIPNQDGLRVDVIEALRELSIPNLRWPGGCFADEYHWRDGIGPRDQRPTMVNSHWGDVIENNHFGTHEFMQLCELLETEPYITGNVGSGTVQEMSQWVEYLTREDDSPMVRLRRENGRDEPWSLRYWGVGNESWGCGGNMRPEYYADLARRYGTFCRDHGENRLYRVACGPNTDNYAWTKALMETVGDLGCGCRPHNHFQAISLHHYTWAGTVWEKKSSATDFDDDQYWATFGSAQLMDDYITRHSSIMDVYDPTRRIGLVVDEWGTWWAPTPGSNPGFLQQEQTMRDALVAAMHLSIFANHAERVVMANLAQTINVLQAVLLTDGPTLLKTPTYQVFKMSVPHQDASRLDVRPLEDVPTREVDGAAVRTLWATATTKDDTALVSLTNLDRDAQSVEFDLRGRDWTLGESLILVADTPQGGSTAAGEEISPVAFTGASQNGTTLRVDLPASSFVTISLALA